MLSLLDSASEFIDLDYRLSDGTIGEALAALLGRIDVAAEPLWCPPASMERTRKSIVAPTQYFFYQPHTFPEMDPLLEKAHKLQHALLPAQPPAARVCEVTAVLESYCHLSGDIFGWQDIDADTVRIWLMDMSGHGLRAGLLAALLRILMDDVRGLEDPATLFAALNQSLFNALTAPDDVLYATGVLIELRPGRLRYVSAAHPAFLRRTASDGIIMEASQGRPLGVFRRSMYDVKEIACESGDVLLLCTDGILEAGAVRGEEFGLHRLEAAFASVEATPQTIAEHIYAQVSQFQDMRTIDDDVTFLVVAIR
jgi:phosphoserine phosphatase RsbU/P